ncbi:MAG: hypothetical protein WCK28_04540 [Burkholderiales bacterium]
MNTSATLARPSGTSADAPVDPPAGSPFGCFDPPVAALPRDPLRAAVTAACREPEPVAVARVLERAQLLAARVRVDEVQAVHGAKLPRHQHHPVADDRRQPAL